jgi:SAM-dependent methyltransferase
MDLSKNYWKILELRGQMPKMQLIKIEGVWNKPENFNKLKTAKILLDEIGYEASVLDIGAGNRYLEKVLASFGFRGTYKSMDIDERYKHDFHSIDEITDKYDCVTMFELIEHLNIETGLAYIEKAKDLLNENGILALSTPNINHINQLWKGDLTHIQQWPPPDLYAILRLMDFRNIKIYRIYIKPNKHPNIIKNILKRVIFPPLNKIVTILAGADYAHGIYIIARRTGEE